MLPAEQINRITALKDITGHTSHKRTICEVWRELFFLTDRLEDRELAKEMHSIILDGYIMGKKMSDRLFKYKSDWDKGQFPENPDFQSDMEYRQEWLDEMNKRIADE